jgi:hypothetical protein
LGTGRNIWFTLSLVLVSALVITSELSVHFYAQYVIAEEKYTNTLLSLKDVSYEVNLLINYNNGTKRWYNQTIVPIGYSLFNATIKITDGQVEGSWSDFGVFVTAINGVQGSGPEYWLWFRWDETENRWMSGATGPNSHIITQGETAAWLLTNDWAATP